MKTEEQFLAEFDEREELIALVLSEAYPQIMINHIEEHISDLPSIQFEVDENAIRIWEVTAQGETVNEETGEEGNWINLEGNDRYFYFADYEGMRGEIFKLEKEFDKLLGKYTEHKDALVDTDHHDAMRYEIQGYVEMWSEYSIDADVEQIQYLIKDLKVQVDAFGLIVEGLSKIKYTFC